MLRLLWERIGLWVGKFPAETFRKFIVIFPEFTEIYEYLCRSAVSKFSIARWCCKISMFLTNNSPDLYALTSCIMLRKNISFLARLYIPANLNVHYRLYNFQAFVNISRNFQKISRYITFSEILQPYAWTSWFPVLTVTSLVLRHVISWRTNCHCAEIECYWTSSCKHVTTVIRLSGFSEAQCIT